jgi:uncharacterized membrane protein
MNVLLEWFTPSRRKWLYGVTGGANALALAVVPVLASLDVVTPDMATKIIEISSSILALVAAVVAIKNVPGSVVDAPAEAEASE